MFWCVVGYVQNDATVTMATESVVPLEEYLKQEDRQSEFSISWGIHQVVVSVIAITSADCDLLPTNVSVRNACISWTKIVAWSMAMSVLLLSLLMEQVSGNLQDLSTPVHPKTHPYLNCGKLWRGMILRKGTSLQHQESQRSGNVCCMYVSILWQIRWPLAN